MKGGFFMFFKSTDDEKYKDVAIPSLFFDLYIPIANGNQIKVYLLGYKSAFFNRTFQNDELNNKVLATIIGISEKEVIEAWRFWEKMGIVKLHPLGDSFAIEFFDIKMEYLKKHTDFNLKTASQNIDAAIDEASSLDYTNMYKQIEKISGRLLTPPEKIDILDSIKQYDLDSKLVIKAFERAVEENGNIKSVKYVRAILKAWFDNNIKTLDDLERNDTEKSDESKNYKTIFKALGFNRLPSSSERNTMHKWLYSLDMSMDLVLKACEKSVNTNKPSIKYFDAILMNWYNKGFKTVAEVEEDDANFAQNKANKSKQTLKASLSKAKDYQTKFHNFDASSSEKYSEESLDRLLKNSNKIK